MEKYALCGKALVTPLTFGQSFREQLYWKKWVYYQKILIISLLVIKKDKQLIYNILILFTLWSWAESNRCPNISAISLLHAYSGIICREITGTGQTDYFLSWIVLLRRHSLLLRQPILFVWFGGEAWQQVSLHSRP